MANEQNLTHKLTENDARKGGIKSGETRRAKKAIKDILNDYLEGEIKESPKLAKIADKLGVDESQSKKVLLAATCVLNTMRDGRLKDLAMLQALLNENEKVSVDTEVEDDPLTKALKEEAERMNNNADKQ